jgi:hypothetical protein
MSGNSTRKHRSRKAADRPKKPYLEFPLKKAGVHHEGIGFYTLRHGFRTVADARKWLFRGPPPGPQGLVEGFQGHE